MRHIASNNIVTISADSEHTNFPASRTQDNHPKRVSKTDDNISTVKYTFGVVGGISDIIVAGTNAATASVSVSNPNQISWGDSDEWGFGFGPELVTKWDFTSPVGSTWSQVSIDNITVIGGVVTITNSGNIKGYIYQEVSVTSGEKHRISIRVVYGAHDGWLRVGDTQYTAEYVDETISSSGATGYEFTPNSDTVFVMWGLNDAVEDNTIDVDYISIKQITDDDVWANDDVSTTATVTQRAGSNSLWIQLNTPIDIPVDAILTLVGEGGTSVYAGIIQANISRTYGDKDPQYGITEGRIDYSILAENSNGSRYYKKRDIVRTFGLTALLSRTQAQKLIDSFDTLGENPSGWKLTDESGSDWVVFGRFNGSPLVYHNYPNHSPVEWTITEVL